MPRSTGRTDVTRSALLAALGAGGPMSRAELARTLRVSPALVTQLTRQLMTDGMLLELDQAPSLGGRPARLIGLAADAGHAVGVKVASDHVTMVEVGIDGAVTRSATEPFDAASATVLAALVGLLRRFIDGGQGARLIGVGVGVPGGVDQQDEGTVDSSLLGWTRVPLGRELRRELALPVLVENNVNALTVAERLYGQGRGHDNVLVVTIGTGVGAGLVTDGRIVRGHAGGAGEIGHLPVHEDGPLCQCGNRGCLEALVGQQALVREARRAGVLGEDGGPAALLAAAEAGDERAQRVYGVAGHTLGRALAGVVNTLDPEVVILLGEGVAAWRHWHLGFEIAFRSALMPRMRGVGLAVETWQDDSWAQGAAALVLATPFDTVGTAGDQGRLVRERLLEQDLEVGRA